MQIMVALGAFVALATLTTILAAPVDPHHDPYGKHGHDPYGKHVSAS